MSTRYYSEEDKKAYIEEFREREETVAKYAKEKRIPETTFRGWLKQDEEITFGSIDLRPAKPAIPNVVKKSIIFACENIRIELKEGFDKSLLRNIMEVLLNDK